MMVFGGLVNNQLTNQVWQLQLADAPTWSFVPTVSPRPTARRAATLSYDPRRNRMLMFGGEDADSVRSDVWVLSLGSAVAWSPLVTTGPRPRARADHSAIYDPVGDRLVIYGGVDHTSSQLEAYGDIWSLSLSDSVPTWQELLAVGDPALPRGRFDHSAVLDPSGHRMLVYGGDFGGPTDDLWSLSLDDPLTWTRLVPAGPRPGVRVFHSAVFDPARAAMVLFGGNDASADPIRDEVWQLPLNGVPSWERLHPEGETPPAREQHSACYDPVRDRMIVFGGVPESTAPTWALDLQGATSWAPFRPVLRSTTAAIRLPTICLGDTAQVAFQLRNQGMSPLALQGYTVSSTTLRLGSSSPVSLGWREHVDQTLVLVGDSLTNSADSIVVHSDDPERPAFVIPVLTDVRPISFQTRVLGDPERVPLGESFIVVATPDSFVTFERAVLFHRRVGDVAFDSVGFSVLGSALAAQVPGATVVESGVEYYVEFRNGGFLARQPAGAPAVPALQRVSAPAAFTVLPLPNSGSGHFAGQDLDLQVLLPAGAALEDGILHVRRAGDRDSLLLTVSTDGLGRMIATVPAAYVGNSGLEYWLELRTRTASLRFPPEPGASAWLQVSLTRLAEPGTPPASRYRLLAVPMEADPVQQASVASMLFDDLGTYDRKRWRLFTYDPALSTSGAIEFGKAPTDLFRLEPGRARWLITRDGS
ncbi:MAG: kelch repeat-containing protein, partial [Candidatus Eisenbacteria bacterium]